MKYRSKNSFENVSDSISIDDYRGKIRDKIKSIYGDDLIEYDVYFTELTHYDGRPYLDCTIGVKYCLKNSENLSEACRLLVSID